MIETDVSTPHGGSLPCDDANTILRVPASRAAGATLRVPVTLTALVVSGSWIERGTEGRAARWITHSTPTVAACVKMRLITLDVRWIVCARIVRRCHGEHPTFTMTVTLRAHYDGEHIVLDEPFEIPANAPLAVTVLTPDSSAHDRERERASWAAISAWSLARAYGDDEPEYTVADLKP